MKGKFAGLPNLARGVILLASLGLVALFFVAPRDSSAARSLTLSNPCAEDPNNLFYNGTFAPGAQTQYGLVADGWTAFIYSGTPPNYNVVDNEKIDTHWSQQIYLDGTFDAGVQQTMHNLQPGTNYWYRLGYALAAKSINGPNVRVQTIGRQVGVDRTGGTDVHSAQIQWSPIVWDGNPAVNIPALTMVFTAQATSATIYFHAIATDGSPGENRVWFDAACSEPRPDLPSSTPVPTTGPPPPSGTRVFLPLVRQGSCAPTLVTTITVGTHPKGVATDAAANRVYTALFDSSSAAFVDGNANTSLGSFSLNNAGHGNGIGAANGRVFASMRDSSTVSILDGASGAFLANRDVGSLPYGVGGTGSRVWVANFGSDTVSVFDATTMNVIATRGTGSGSMPALVAAASNRAFVSLWGSGAADIASDGTLSHTYPLGAGTFGVAFNAATNRLYASNRNTNQITLLDPNTGTILGSVILGQVPYALAVNPSTNRLFIVLADVNQVEVRDGATLAKIATLGIGSQGGDGGDAIGGMNGRVYIANNAVSTMTVIDDSCSQ